MNKKLASLVALAVLGLGATADALAKSRSAPLDSVVIEWGEFAPRLYFFRAKKDGGGVVLKLNEEGLFKDDAKLCAWNAPKFEASERRKMELSGCPASVPVKTSPGEIKIKVTRLDKSLAQVEYGGETLYLNLSRIPKSSWHSEGNAKSGAQIRSGKLARLAADESLEAYKKEVKACFEKEKPTGCLSKFVVDRIYAPGAAAANAGDSMVSGQKFIAYLWESRDKDCDDGSCQLWDEFQRCFDAKAVVEFGAIRLVGPSYFCELLKDADGWKVSLFGKNPSNSQEP